MFDHRILSRRSGHPNNDDASTHHCLEVTALPADNPVMTSRAPHDKTARNPRTGRVTVTLPDRRQIEEEAHTYYYPPGY